MVATGNSGIFQSSMKRLKQHSRFVFDMMESSTKLTLKFYRSVNGKDFLDYSPSSLISNIKPQIFSNNPYFLLKFDWSDSHIASFTRYIWSSFSSWLLQKSCGSFFLWICPVLCLQFCHLVTWIQTDAQQRAQCSAGGTPSAAQRFSVPSEVESSVAVLWQQSGGELIR